MKEIARYSGEEHSRKREELSRGSMTGHAKRVQGITRRSVVLEQGE